MFQRQTIKAFVCGVVCTALLASAVVLYCVYTFYETRTITVPHSLLKTQEDWSAVNRLEEIFQRLDKNYYRELTFAELAGLAEEGIETIDPNTWFNNEEEALIEQQDNEGVFGGVGIYIEKTPENSAVAGVLIRELVGTDVPATQAKPKALAAGDIITHIVVDGTLQETASMNIRKVQILLRGSVGSDLELKVVPEGETLPERRVVTRGLITVVFVESELKNGGIAYVRLKSFDFPAIREFDEAIIGLREKNGKPFSGFILDLRGNPGGFVSVASAIADRILTVTRCGEMPLMWEESRGKVKTSPLLLSGTRDMTGGAHMVVLVDAGTASASEILAGNLKKCGRAVIAGTHTYGKGTVQVSWTLASGGSYHVTTSQYLIGYCRDPIQWTGVVPDILLKEDGKKTDARREKDQENSLRPSTAKDKDCTYKATVSKKDMEAAFWMLEELKLELAEHKSP